MNAVEHRMIGALALTVAGATLSPKPEEVLLHGAAGCVGGYCFGTLPDGRARHQSEPSAFLVFAGALGYGLYRLYRWRPESAEGKVLRVIGLAAGGAYLIHLGAH